ncbi:transposase [Scytonema sp. UIC 10036]|uniref:transposase n=1 Tax=Scytonema sp. UIC 10036 TaxID=2304196 RepID=UPI00325B6672
MCCRGNAESCRHESVRLSRYGRHENSFNNRKMCQLMIRWFEEIVGYFDERTTSGAVEGINNKLKLIKRLGYGFRNFNNFRLRSL